MTLLTALASSSCSSPDEPLSGPTDRSAHVPRNDPAAAGSRAEGGSSQRLDGRELKRTDGDAVRIRWLGWCSASPLLGEYRVRVPVDPAELGVEGVLDAVLLSPHPHLLQHAP